MIRPRISRGEEEDDDEDEDEVLFLPSITFSSMILDEELTRFNVAM